MELGAAGTSSGFAPSAQPGVDLSRRFTELRASPETAWLSSLGREPFNQVLRDVERSWSNFFAGRARRPRRKRFGTVMSVRFALDQRRTLVVVDRFYPSSKTCSACGVINGALRLRDRSWTCPACGAAHDRDQKPRETLSEKACAFLLQQVPRGAGKLTRGENHAHAVALHCLFYNFERIHKTLRVTPAMQAGLSDHVWSLEEIAALIPAPVAKKRGPYRKRDSETCTALRSIA